MGSAGSTVVDPLTVGPNIKGSNPTSTWHQKKMMGEEVLLR